MKSRFILFNVSFLGVIFVFLSLINAYAMGDIKVENINLTNFLKVENVDRVVVSTENFTNSRVGAINREVSNNDQLKEILNSMNSLREVPVCDTLPQYKLSFYKGTREIYNLGFFIDGEWYFLRLNSPDGQRDFEPGKEFVEVIKAILKEKGDSNH